MGAKNAVSPPYSVGAKTRLETDPWWELDLSRTRHVHSVRFVVVPKVHRRMTLLAMCLPRPLGFQAASLDR